MAVATRYAFPIRLCLLLGLLTFGALPAAAQVVGDCEPGTAERGLNINDVRAHVFNGGNLFFGNTTTAGNGYIVPKGTAPSPTPLSPIFAAQLWIGGKVSGELRMASAVFSAFEFWPGPLDEDGNPPKDCSVYDRIYRVSRGDVARYHETGEATDDLRDWPAHLGAPVLDGDGVEGNYNLAGGDEPAISGEQMVWWVMNDRGNVHRRNETPPVGLEMRVEVFAAPSRVPAINQATFYRYRIRYRGEQPLDSAYVALFADVDVGDASDDFIGSDTTLDMGFAYNRSETDGVYGIPPAFGIKIVQGPKGLPDGRDNDGDGEIDEADEPISMGANPLCHDTWGPYTAIGNYRCLRGLHRTGEVMTEGNRGDGNGPITTFAFPGDPVTGEYWSEENIDGEGTQAGLGDRGMWPSFGPFLMEPGEETEVVLALPFAQGTDRLDSVVKLREAARILQNAYGAGLFEPQRVQPAPTEPPPSQAFALRTYPNPFAASASVELTVADGAGALRLAVYDVIGREVAVLADGALAPGEHPFTLSGARLPAGVYFVRLETRRQTETLKLLHVE